MALNDIIVPKEAVVGVLSEVVLTPAEIGASATEPADDIFRIVGSADATKKVAFEVDGIDAATTRTLTVPNSSGTIARTEDFASPPSIGNTTPNSGAFTTLAANNGALTASAPVLDLSQTWNNAAVTFTALRFNAINTNSSAFSLFADFQVGGTTQFSVRRDGVVFAQNRINIVSAVNGFEVSTNASGASAVRYLSQSSSGEAGIRAGANIVEVMGITATNPQTLRIYNTFTNATNHERGFMRWSSNELQIGTEAGSSGGTERLMGFYRGANYQLQIGNGQIQIRGSTAFRWEGRSAIHSDGVGTIRLNNAAGNDFGRLQFGGTTSSFPALKRDTTTLQVKLADDSAFAPFECAGLTLNGDLTASTRNIVTDTTTGTKIGTGTTQKLGFFNATPAVQPAAVADATDAASTQARLNDLLARLRALGLIAT